MIKKEANIIWGILIISACCFGGFYTSSKAVLAGICSAVLLWFSMREKNIVNVRFSELEGIGVLTILTSIWAVDRSRNLEGIIGLAVLLLFKCVIDNFDEKAILTGLEAVPYIGVAMTCLGLVTIPLGTESGFFWQADRFGGSFQYSNTCALFMLMGLSIEFGKTKENAILKYSIEAGLILGLLLTGSRMAGLIFIGWGIFKFVTVKEKRKSLGIFAGVTAAFVGIFIAVTGSLQNVGRLFTLASSNSTVWGRILYYKDGLRMLFKHPLGLGYYGYYLIQGAEQQGIYDVKYVHNDFLQAGLDYGIIATALLLIFLFMQLKKGKQNQMRKELLVIIAIACLADFHIQYALIGLVAMLCCDFSVCLFNFTYSFKGQKLPVTLGSLVLMIAGIYFGIGFGSLQKGDYETAQTMLKNNTESLELELSECSDAETAELLIEKILKQNQYSAVALNSKVYLEMQKGLYKEAVDGAMDSIGKDKYNSDLYSAYYSLFASGIEVATDAEDSATLKEGMEKIADKLAEVRNDTDSLAEHLKDQVTFDEFVLE